MATMSDGDAEVHRIGFTLLKGSGAPKLGPFRAKYVLLGSRGPPGGSVPRVRLANVGVAVSSLSMA